MFGIFRFELKKAVSKLTLAVIAAAVAVDIYMMLFSYSGVMSFFNDPAQRESVHAIAGTVNEGTFDEIERQKTEFASLPENQVTDEWITQRAEQMVEEFLQSYNDGLFSDLSKEEYDELSDVNTYIARFDEPLERLSDEARNSAEWLKLADQQNAVSAALETRQNTLKNFDFCIVQSDGAVRERWEQLRDDYLAHGDLRFDYSAGWEQFSYEAQNMLPPLLGMVIVVGVASLFSVEKTSRVDSLILSSKYGRRKAAAAKAAAGFAFSAAAWLLFELINAVISFSVYGFYGADATCLVNADSPFYMTNLQFAAQSAVNSLLASMYLCGIIMAVSAAAKNRIVALLVGVAALLLPYVAAMLGLPAVTTLSGLLPGRLMNGADSINEYASIFDIFGFTLTDNYVIPLLSLLIAAITAALAVAVFRRWQVKS